MSIPEEPIIPKDPPSPEVPPPAARARRRRAQRAAMFPTDAEGQAALIASLSRRAYPTLELFVFSLVCGAIVGCGFLFNSQAVILLGVLVAPLMVPWVGLLLALYIGSPRFLFETLRALLISAAIVFFCGLLTGFAARALPDMTRDNVYIHAQLWPPDLLVLALGAVTLAASFARSEDKPVLPSILIAYAFYLPLNASGFGLGAALEGVWVEGLLVFVVHFALASLLGLITLFVLKLEPTKAGGIASGIVIVALVVLSVALMYPQAATGIIFVKPPTQTTTPSMIFTASPSVTAALARTDMPPASATQTPSLTPTFQPPTLTVPPSATSEGGETPVSSTPTQSPAAAFTPIPATLAVTKTPSLTPTASQIPAATSTVAPSPTFTSTATPQPLLGRIEAGESGGANLRQTPEGKYILTLPNGTVVEISPEKRIVNGVEWARVFATVDGQRLEGWLISSVIVYDNVTPSP